MKHQGNTAFIVLPCYPAFIFLAPVLLCPSLSAHAGPFLTTLGDFHLNCDIRQLNLSVDQHAALCRLRINSKQINDKAYCKTVRSDCNRCQTIIKIFSGDSFGSNATRDYVEGRYLFGMDYVVDEMEIQYRPCHLLNPRQHQQWLSLCLR